MLMKPMANPPASILGEDYRSIVESGREARPDGRAFSGVLLIVATLGIAYLVLLLFTDLPNPFRLLLAVGGFLLSVGIVVAVLNVMPLLPSPVMKPGKMTPLTVWVVAIVHGTVGVWALWGGRRAYLQRGDTRLFGGLLLLAVFVW